RAGTFMGNNLSVSTTWALSLRGGRDGARPSHSSLQPLVAYFSASQLPRFSAGRLRRPAKL
ncbi:MAG: hypothetical protein IKR48_11850, partial [Kiritimatiellae bacterium]|nr:hypothetical protein [Kiritimatiellia bacterium]